MSASYNALAIIAAWSIVVVLILLVNHRVHRKPTATGDVIPMRVIRNLDGAYDELSRWQFDLLDAAHEARDEGDAHYALATNRLAMDVSKARQLLSDRRDALAAK